MVKGGVIPREVKSLKIEFSSQGGLPVMAYIY